MLYFFNSDLLRPSTRTLFFGYQARGWLIKYFLLARMLSILPRFLEMGTKDTSKNKHSTIKELLWKTSDMHEHNAEGGKSSGQQLGAQKRKVHMAAIYCAPVQKRLVSC